MAEMTRGDVKPDLQINLTDASGTANFIGITASQVRVIGELGGSVLFDSEPTEVTPSGDGTSMIVRRVWAPEDTDEVGILWVTVVVDWPSDKAQSFPEEGPLRLDIRRAPGDA